ncbi:MAG: VTT domain-containing protein [Acidobacteriota bacterium]
MSNPPPARPAPATKPQPEPLISRRGAALRFALLAVIVVAGFALFRWTPLGEAVTDGRLLEAVRDSPWAPVVFIAIFAVLCPVGMPVSPVVAVGGVFFGVGLGTLYNFLGCFSGAATSYGLARLLGRDFVATLGRGGRLQRVERTLRRQSFWNLVVIRFVPLPFPLVNYGAALSGIRAFKFLAATAVGLAPAIAIYTYLGAAVVTAASEGGREGLLPAFLALGGLILLTFIPRLLTARRRRKRLADLRAERAKRRR